jgi:hypothetical protein
LFFYQRQWIITTDLSTPLPPLLAVEDEAFSPDSIVHQWSVAARTGKDVSFGDVHFQPAPRLIVKCMDIIPTHKPTPSPTSLQQYYRRHDKGHRQQNCSTVALIGLKKQPGLESAASCMGAYKLIKNKIYGHRPVYQQQTIYHGSLHASYM